MVFEIRAFCAVERLVAAVILRLWPRQNTLLAVCDEVRRANLCFECTVSFGLTKQILGVDHSQCTTLRIRTACCSTCAASCASPAPPRTAKTTACVSNKPAYNASEPRVRRQRLQHDNLHRKRGEQQTHIRELREPAAGLARRRLTAPLPNPQRPVVPRPAFFCPYCLKMFHRK
jgi:hypothetical protein